MNEIREVDRFECRVISVIQNLVWKGITVEENGTRGRVYFGRVNGELNISHGETLYLGINLEHALVNLGGDLHALGQRGLPELRGAAWNIEIQHPRPTAGGPGAPLALLPLGRGGLATSGDYERFFIHQGQRYCHVLNPTTGWPAPHWQSVSVLAANTSTAGALTTIAMLKGLDATAWLDAQGARYLAVQHDGQLRRSAAF